MNGFTSHNNTITCPRGTDMEDACEILEVRAKSTPALLLWAARQFALEAGDFPLTAVDLVDIMEALSIIRTTAGEPLVRITALSRNDDSSIPPVSLSASIGA